MDQDIELHGPGSGRQRPTAMRSVSLDSVTGPANIQFSDSEPEREAASPAVQEMLPAAPHQGESSRHNQRRRKAKQAQRGGTPHNNVTQHRGRPRRYIRTGSGERTIDRETGDSSESGNSLRNEAPPDGTVRKWVDHDSDLGEDPSPTAQAINQAVPGPNPNEDDPTPAPGGTEAPLLTGGLGLRRAILLETKRRNDERTDEDVPDGVCPRGAKVRAFIFSEDQGGTKWARFHHALDAAVEEARMFIVILEGEPTDGQIEDIRDVQGFRQGARRFLKKKRPERQLPSICGEDIIFDSPFLYSEDQKRDGREPLAARYVRVWISNSKYFAVVHDLRHDLGAPKEMPDTWQGFQKDMQVVREQHSIALILLHHYNASSRWARYESSGWWLAIDLYSSLYINPWNKAHDELAEDVERYRDGIIEDFTEAPITQLSSSLHKGQSRLLFLLELKRYQGAVFERLDLFISGMFEDYYPAGLRFRIHSMIHQADLTQKVIDLLLKKVDDSLNLLFNITAVNESRSISRLTYLAFVYVPLSFATSVWGMTQFKIAVEWVAVLALPLLILTVLLVVVSHVLAGKLDDRKMKQIKARAQNPV